MFFRVTHCVPDDSPIIGFLQTSPLSGLHKLQLGTATPESLKDWLANGYHSLISRTNAATNDDPKTYLKVVAQHADDNINRGEMIAFAEWELPYDVHVPKTGGDIEGTQPPGMNHAFAREMGPCLREMRDRVLRGKKCFVLDHLYTFPQYQRRGAATLLLSWPFEQADKAGLLVYLDSEADGPGAKLYEKLGFKKVDECQVDLTRCGLEGVYTHVAMVRKPKKVTAE